MIREDIVVKVKDAIASQLGVAMENIKAEDNIIGAYGADNLDVVEIAMSVEEALSIELIDSDMDKVKMVNDLVELACSKAGC